MSAAEQQALAAAAAALVVDEGMEYAAAKRKAARDQGRHGHGGRRGALPSNEMIEDAVREHIALFHADSQPAELHALRELALGWMQRLAAFRPHLGGAAWRGTATRRSALHIDLYCDDPKSAQISLLNMGVDFDDDALERPGEAPLSVLTVASRCEALQDWVSVHLLVRDLDEQRGALRAGPDGRTWRGDAVALQRLLDQEQAAP